MRLILLLVFFVCACDSGTKTEPVKNNVLKQYVKTPLDKTKSMKAEIESKQRKAQDQLRSIGE